MDWDDDEDFGDLEYGLCFTMDSDCYRIIGVVVGTSTTDEFKLPEVKQEVKQEAKQEDIGSSSQKTLCENQSTVGQLLNLPGTI